MLVLLDGQKALSDKVDTIIQILEDRKPDAKNSSKATVCHMHVNGLVMGLLVEYPDRVWTSGDLAKEIGCTSAAIRQTKTWKAYQKQQEAEKQSRPQQKGFKDKHGNLDAFNAGGTMNVEHQN